MPGEVASTFLFAPFLLTWSPSLSPSSHITTITATPILEQWLNTSLFLPFSGPSGMYAQPTIACIIFINDGYSCYAQGKVLLMLDSQNHWWTFARWRYPTNLSQLTFPSIHLSGCVCYVALGKKFDELRFKWESWERNKNRISWIVMYFLNAKIIVGFKMEVRWLFRRGRLAWITGVQGLSCVNWVADWLASSSLLLHHSWSRQPSITN